MSTDVYATAARLHAEGTPFVLATVVARYPPQSVRPGAKAIVYADGTIDGWVGGGCVQPVVIQEAAEALGDGQPRLVRLHAGAATASSDDEIREYPMTCQGEGGVEIYLEPVLAAPRLVVLGHTPVARAIAGFGAELGFDVVAAPVGGTAGLFPAGVRVAADVLAALAGADGSAWVVVATMGAGDEEALAAAAASDAGYVGLVASRKKGGYLADYVRADGVAAERVGRVKFPAGLDLGGMTAPEIALSVLAEIVQLRHARGARPAQRVRGAPPDIESTATLPPARHPIAPAGTAPVPAAVAAPARPPRALTVAPLPLDPVCGMPVNPAEARHTLVVAGETLYFCCPHCKRAYERRAHETETETTA